MLLLVGLGNPGAKYAQNRHNAGCHAVEAIADAQAFGSERKKFQGAIREGALGGIKALTLCPETYYNESGNAVKAAAQFYKIPADHIVVFHDEIDLAPGKLRVKKGGGLAGNNGLRSINAHFGPDFWRVRIGIGHPGHKDRVTAFVLGDFSKAERADYYDDLLRGIGQAAPHLVGLDDAAAGRFMSAVVQPGNAGRPVAATPHVAPPAPSADKPVHRASPFDVLKGLRGPKS